MKPSSISAPFAASGTCVEECARGLESEVVSLFEQFRDRLLRYLIALGLDAHDGEEVVQETFLALFQHLKRGKSRRNLRAWIFRVAHNLGLKQRYRNRQQRGAGQEHLAELHADPGPSPEEQIVLSERHARLRAVLQALPDREKWCLNLRAEGLRYREIAEVLDVSLGLVSLMLGRSLARFRGIDEK